jgi:uncharacterized membrane protein
VNATKKEVVDNNNNNNNNSNSNIIRQEEEEACILLYVVITIYVTIMAVMTLRLGGFGEKNFISIDYKNRMMHCIRL